MPSKLKQAWKQSPDTAKNLVLETFDRTGNFADTAFDLGVSSSTLSYWLLKLNLRLITTLVEVGQPVIYEEVFLPTKDQSSNQVHTQN